MLKFFLLSKRIFEGFELVFLNAYLRSYDWVEIGRSKESAADKLIANFAFISRCLGHASPDVLSFLDSDTLID